MKKTLKRSAMILAAGAMLIGSAISAHAELEYNGQWCVENDGYWFKLTEDGSTFLANTWYWIKDSDGVIRCYYFDQNGWLVTNQTIEDAAGSNVVNEQGQWVVDGVIQTRTEADGGFAAHTDLSAGKAAETQAAVQSEAAPAAVEAAGSGPSATGTSTTVGSGRVGKNKYKSSGAGDNPANASFAQAYENSSISGGTVTNNWANFRMTFSSVVPKSDTSGTGTDFYIDSDDTANMIVTYYPLDKYSAGNTNLDAFVGGFLADARGYRGGSRASDVTLGAYSFKQLTKPANTPDGMLYDHAYIRQVDGTNYAMVITVESNGESENFMSVLNGMSKVR